LNDVASNGIAAIVLVGAATLGVAGLAKLRAPGAAVPAFAAAGLPARPWLARVLGALELLATAAFLLRPSSLTAAMVMALYWAFSVVVVRALARGAHQQPCGCLGETGGSIGVVHLCFDLTVASAATLTVAGDLGHAAGLLQAHPLLGPSLAVATYLAVLVLVEFGRASRADGVTTPPARSVEAR
jgi:hypothetical protein